MHLSIIALLLMLCFSLNYVAFSFAGTITQFLCGFGIDYSSPEFVKAQEEGGVVATEICREGFTLLKNEDNCLPLRSPKVNVFGWGACDNGFIYQGGGSGEGSSGGRVSFYEGLRQSGLELNEDLVSAYNALSWRRSEYTTNVPTYYRLYEAPASFYTDALLSQAKEFSDTAIVVLGRRGAEGNDLPKIQYDKDGNEVTDRKYSAITVDEENMLRIVCENFDKVVVIMNTSNPMECGFLDDDGVDAALIMYLPGNKGTPVVGEILLGDVTPSGKTVDTFAYDLSTAATYPNAGVEGVHWPRKNDAIKNSTYVDYAESLYIGYMWYETADAMGFWDTPFARDTWGIRNGYSDVVQYPFGFGLSYTQFQWTVEHISISDGSILDKDAEIEIDVFVENVGNYSGKDVVELYYSAPYKRNGIEKSSLKLADFAKTGELKPGEGERLTLSVKLRDMASYDCYDANGNGFMGYEAEEGVYTLSLRTDAHTLASVKGSASELHYTVPENGYLYETDDVTGYPVTNRFTTYTNTLSGASSVIEEKAISKQSKAYSVDGGDLPNLNFAYLTRSDFEGTLPIYTENRQVSDAFYNSTWLVNDPRVDQEDEMPVTNSTSTSWTLNDLIYQDEAGEYKMVDYGDKMWDELVSQLSVETMATLVAHGGFTTDAIGSINKPVCYDKDGPSGFNARITGGDGNQYCTNYPCETIIASTWNWKMAYQMGLSIGKEGAAAGIDGWYGPACNMHRSPLGGRNFEYYSEDPYLSGIMCAYAVRGAKENGVYSYVKHFAVNDNDAGRGGEYKWLTEQSLREIYLKPFEMAVKIGGANGMMGSVDRVGSVRATGSYALLTEVLRNEWGFKGTVITDYYQGGDINDIDEGIRAGNNLALAPSGAAYYFDDLDSATAVTALQKGVKGILYTYVDTRYTAMTSLGLDLSSVIGTKTEVYPWWIWILAGLDVIIVGGCALWGGLVIKKSRRKSS